MELGGDLPLHSLGWVERYGDSTVVETARPHDGCRHVDVRVGRIDCQVRAVDVIAEDLVFHGNHAAVLGNDPAVWIRSGHRDLAALAIECMNVVDILREIMRRVAARRGSAHSQFERRTAQLFKRDLDLHPPVLRLGKSEAVPNRPIRAE